MTRRTERRAPSARNCLLIGWGRRHEQLCRIFSCSSLRATTSLPRGTAWMRALATARSSFRRPVTVISDSGFQTVPQLALARVLGCWVVYDKFIPLYERHVEDRTSFRRRSAKGFALGLYDIVTCWLAHVVIADTSEHCRYLARFSRRSARHFVPCLPASLGEGLRACEPEEHASPVVFWCGSGQGFHGADVVARVAIELARTGTASTTLIGANSIIEPIVHDWMGRGVDVYPRMEFAEVWQHLCAADVVLGAFGSSPKGDRVVPLKILDAACAGKPVITQESVALQEHFPDLLTFAPRDPDSIVGAVRSVLEGDPGAAGSALRAYYHAHLDPPSVARDLLARTVPAGWAAPREDPSSAPTQSPGHAD